MAVEKLTDWMQQGNTSFRMLVGGNPNDMGDWVAFVEKKPRVRVSKRNYVVGDEDGYSARTMQQDAWIMGPEESSTEFDNLESSRQWCDNMLKLLVWQ